MLDLFGTAEKRFFYGRSRADVGSSPRLTARQAANGTTIVICSASTDAMNPFLYKRLPFHGRARLRQTQPAHLRGYLCGRCRKIYAGAAVK